MQKSIYAERGWECLNDLWDRKLASVGERPGKHTICGLRIFLNTVIQEAVR